VGRQVHWLSSSEDRCEVGASIPRTAAIDADVPGFRAWLQVAGIDRACDLPEVGISGTVPSSQLSGPPSATRWTCAPEAPRLTEVHNPQLSRGKSRAPLIVAPKSPRNSLAVADMNEPTVSPVWAAPSPAWPEKNCPMQDAEVGATARLTRPGGTALLSRGDGDEELTHSPSFSCGLHDIGSRRASATVELLDPNLKGPSPTRTHLVIW
jgi:hypothetical protein